MQVHILEQEYENQNDEEEETPERVIDQVRRCLCHSITLFAIPFLIITIATPILLFYFIIDQENYHYQPDNYTCLVGDTFKIPCGKPNSTYLQCTSNLCCYIFKTQECYHSVPSTYFYKKVDSSQHDYAASQNLTPLVNKTVPKLAFKVCEIDEHRLQIDLNSPRDCPAVSKAAGDKTYEVKMHKDHLGVEVFRAHSNELIFTTFNGPLIASDGFWEWSFHLTNEKIFGLGELMIGENGTSKVIYKNRKDHNTLPIFMALRNGKFHGARVEHDGPLEVTVLPSNLVVLRSLAGSKIVISVSTGPTPKDVRRQQSGQKEAKVPYWALGAHICRDGLTTMDLAVEEYNSFVATKEKKIQFSSDCIHENLYAMLNEKDPKHKLEELIRDLQKESHFMMSISPHVLKQNSDLYSKAIKLDVAYKDEKGRPFNGTYMKEQAIYLDFIHKSIDAWMIELQNSLPSLVIDGFVLRDNWPAEDNYRFEDNKFEFPYMNKEINTSMSNTLAWNAISSHNATTNHIVLHNKYGASQAEKFHKNFKFDFLITSSYDHSVQGAAQVQNVDISWGSLKRAIKTTLYHSVFTNSLISIPICGSTTNYSKSRDEEVCIRWYLTAATFPLFRISSEEPRRDPYSFGTQFARDAALRALKNRFDLLPYYYTIVSNSEPLVRPMFYDFYSDNETLSLDEQYMLGDAFLVAQPLAPAAKRLRLYLPPSVEVWYEFWGGRRINKTKWVEINVAETDWVMFIAQGFVVPMRNNDNPIIRSYSPQDKYSFAVALKCNESCAAQGTLRFEKESLSIKANANELMVENILLVQKEIGCEKTDRIWPSIVASAKIYDKFVKKSTFKEIDLCTQTDDKITIKYFV